METHWEELLPRTSPSHLILAFCCIGVWSHLVSCPCSSTFAPLLFFGGGTVTDFRVPWHQPQALREKPTIAPSWTVGLTLRSDPGTGLFPALWLLLGPDAMRLGQELPWRPTPPTLPSHECWSHSEGRWRGERAWPGTVLLVTQSPAHRGTLSEAVCLLICTGGSSASSEDGDGAGTSVVLRGCVRSWVSGHHSLVLLGWARSWGVHLPAVLEDAVTGSFSVREALDIPSWLGSCF